jgi:TonB family protein
MKNLILSIFLISSLSSFAGKTFDITIDIEDVYTKNRVASISLTFTNTKTKKVWQAASDDKGKLKLIEVKGNYFEVTISDKSGYYLSKTFDYSQQNNKDKLETFYLYPSEKVHQQWIAEEDEKYGDDNSGPLALDQNSGDMICGCSFDDFGDASYNGGAAEMQRFIANNVMYPQESIHMNEQGRVFVSYIVEVDGTITHVKVVKGSSPFLDAEAIRLVRIMQNWEPATCGANKVRSVCHLPINFTLN